VSAASVPADDAVARYAQALAGTGVDPGRYVTYAERLFHGVPLAGRRVLDVGGGAGLISFYAGARGASVVCLEPGAEGSNPQMDAVYARLTERLGDAVDVRRDPHTFQQLDPEAEAFDVLVLHNSVNHLDEDACRALPRDTRARDTYANLFRALRAMARPGADLLVADCARLNLFGLLGLRNPFVPDVEWRLHQQPRVWAELLAEAGFADFRVRWNPMTRAGRPGEVLLANWIGAFATQSHFTLRARAVD
jgi:SAM-dependent methyltransferase